MEITTEQIAQIIINFKKKKQEVWNEQSQDTFNEDEFLIDEFCYVLESNPNFNEKKIQATNI